jgi:sortase (surface protein transpeptidase)
MGFPRTAGCVSSLILGATVLVALMRGVSATGTDAPLVLPPDLSSPPNVFLSTEVSSPPTPPHVVIAPATATMTVTVSAKPTSIKTAPSPTSSAPPPNRSSTANGCTATKLLPTAIRIPAIGVTSRDVVAVGRNPDKTLQVPPLSKVGELGWYCLSPVPGATGPSIVLAHDEQHGQHGLFWNLGQLQAGDEVELDRSDGQTATFRVTQAMTIPKPEFAQETSIVTSSTPDPQLRLISCSGLTSQEVVFANLVALRPTVGAPTGGH